MKNMILPKKVTDKAKASAKQIGALLMSPGLTLMDIEFAAQALEQVYRSIKPEVEAQERVLSALPNLPISDLLAMEELKQDLIEKTYPVRDQKGFAKKKWEV